MIRSQPPNGRLLALGNAPRHLPVALLLDMARSHQVANPRLTLDRALQKAAAELLAVTNGTLVLDLVLDETAEELVSDVVPDIATGEVRRTRLLLRVEFASEHGAISTLRTETTIERASR